MTSATPLARHAQDRDRRHVRQRRAREHPDHARHLRADAAGAGRPDSTYRTWPASTAPTSAGRTSQQGLRPASRTSSTAPRSRTTPTAVQRRPGAAERRHEPCTSTSRRSTRSQIATGGSLLDLQTPGATINVVTKRGTNADQGLRPLLLRFRRIGSRTTRRRRPIDAGPPDRTAPLHPRLRRRARRPDHQGQALDLGSGIPAGHRPQLTTGGPRRQPHPVRHQDRALNGQDQRPDHPVQRGLTSTITYSDRFETGVGTSAVPPARDHCATSTSRRTSTSSRTSQVFSPDLFATSPRRYQYLATNSTCGQPATTTSRPLLRRHLAQQLALLRHQEPAVSGATRTRRSSSTRATVARAEVRLQLSPADQRLGLGLAGRAGLRLRVLEPTR